MTKLHQVYECKVCGNRVEVIRGRRNTSLLQSAYEPLWRILLTLLRKAYRSLLRLRTDRVQVGSVIHPMIEEHYIEWIELVADGMVYRKHSSPAKNRPSSLPTPRMSMPGILQSARALRLANIYRKMP